MGKTGAIGCERVNVAGEEIYLRGDKSFYWPRANTLVIADLHLGKAESLRKTGTYLPRGATQDDLNRIDRALRETGASRLLILGDAVHAKSGLDRRVVGEIDSWREQVLELEIAVVQGNHDRRVGEFPKPWRFEIIEPPLIEESLRFEHVLPEQPTFFTWAGHIHPCVKLRGPGRQSLRLPCFVISTSFGLMPSFGTMTGSHIVRPFRDSRVFVVSEENLFEVGRD